MKFYKQAFLATLGCACVSLSFAELRVVVTPTRSEQPTNITPANVTVITNEEIQQSGAQSVSDILRNQAGINVVDLFGDGSRASVSLRGFSSGTAGQNVLILVDGRRLNNGDLSNPEINSILLSNIDRIEIIKGSAGVLYGNQAVGGVINIISKVQDDFSGHFEISAGRFDKTGANTSLGQRYENGVYYRVAAEQKRSNNYRDNNALDYQNVSVKVGLQEKGDHDVFFEYQRTTENLEFPGALIASEVEEDRRQSFINFNNDFADRGTTLYRLRAENQLNDAWELSADYTYEEENTLSRLSFRSFANPSVSPSRRVQRMFSPKLTGDLEFDGIKVDLTAGIDYEDIEYLNTRGTETTRENSELYFQSVFGLNETVSMTLGARYTDYEDVVISGTGEVSTDQLLSSSFGVNAGFENGFKTHFRVDQNYRLPNVDEFTFIETSRTSLDYQSGLSIETGVGYVSNNSTIGLSIFQLDIEDEIAFDPTADGPGGAGTGANVNLDETRRRGVDFTFEQTVTSFLALSTNYAYVEAEFLSGFDAGNTVSGVPEETAKFGVTVSPTENLSIYADAQFVGNAFLSGDDSNAQSQRASYTIYNANVSYAINDFYFRFRVNNLGNKLYAESQNAFGAIQPSPERNVNFTFGTKF